MAGSKSNGEKVTGYVKWFDAKKGYGFIAADDKDDIFVHFSNIEMGGFKKLDQGDFVEFELKNDSDKGRGAEAIKVKIIIKDRRY
jgi:CspA family cold shock protein